MKKVVVLVLILAVLAGGGYFAYHKLTGKSTKTQQAFSGEERLYEVQRGSITKTISANGQVEPAKEKDLNFSSNGVIKQVIMQAGQRVKKGDLLATIENTQQELNMIKAKNNYELAKISAAKAEQKEKELEYKLAEKEYQDTFLRAPFDGLITEVGVEKDDTLGSGNNAKVAGHIIDDSRFVLRLSIDEVDIAQIQKGQMVNISLEAFPDKRYRGKVTSVGLTATNDSGVRTVPVEVSLGKENQGILSGLSATAEIVVGQVEDALIVPVTATIARRGNVMVMRKDETGKIVPTQITKGLSNDIMIEVTEGLNEGDQIVINNSSAIQGIRNQQQGNMGQRNMMNMFGGNNAGGNRTNRGGNQR